MRIISGRAGGIRLAVPDTTLVRPTEDKVKEALFAALGDITDMRVLDLYSGTGALGLEALSRGAACVTMVEREPRHVEVIRRNLAAVQKAMANARGNWADIPIGTVQLLSGDVSRLPRTLAAHGPYDLILADPPYHTAPGEFGSHELLRSAEYAALGIPGNTILVLEHETSIHDLPWNPDSSWQLLKERSFGIRTIAFAKLLQQ